MKLEFIDLMTNKKNDYYIDRLYNVIKCTIYKNDDDYKKIYDEAQKKYATMNSHKANNSTEKRSNLERFVDCFAGFISELAVKNFFDEQNLPVIRLDSNSSLNQKDLIIERNKKIIEVRSSFVYKSIEFAIFSKEKNYKIVGPYINEYKPNEITKDYYITTLFETKKDKILEAKEIVLYIIGAATKEMMNDDKISFNDPLDNQNNNQKCKTLYRVIRICDSISIFQLLENILNDN